MLNRSLDETCKKVADDIRAMHAIVLIGAGASLQAGMPLTGQLYPILWNTLDNVVLARKQLAEKLNCFDAPAKNIIGYDWDKLMVAFAVIGENSAARVMFQKAFSEYDKDKSTPSLVHLSLARLIHTGYIEMVISLNWDTHLEKSWTSLYGTNINSEKTILHKPHGDANKPLEDWVFPNEAGRLNESILQEVARKNKNFPKVLCILGYSERDNLIVQELIKPLEEKCRVYRISPNTHGEGALNHNAEDIVPNITTLLYSDNIFDQITFKNQRDIGAAIAGERLGASDVLACPRLPQISLAKSKLNSSHCVTLTGSAGCGKSITCYQLAYDYLIDGWEVLRINEKQTISDNLLLALNSLNFKTVVLIEDAHLWPLNEIKRLCDCVNDKLKIILSRTESLNEISNDIRISNLQAIQVMQDYYLTHKKEVQNVVKEYDKTIGNSYLDEDIVNRIKTAADQDTPWLFNFVLRGGWNQIKHEISVWRDLDRADYLYVIIAACQIVSLDASVSIETIYEYAKYFNKQKHWVDDSIKYLKKRNMILLENGIRCLHIRCASNALIYYMQYANIEEHNQFLTMLTMLITRNETPLLGISWLLHTQEMNRYGRRLINDSVWKVIVARCLSNETTEKRDAAFVLNVLTRYRKQADLEPYFDRVSVLINNIDNTSAFALGAYINDVYNEDKALFERLLKKVSPNFISARLNDSTIDGLYGWGHFLSRLALSKNTSWKTELLTHIDQNRMEHLVQSVTFNDAGKLSEFLLGCISINKEFGYKLFELSIDFICQAFCHAPLLTWKEIHDRIIWLALGYGPFDVKPNALQKKYAKQIVDKLSITKIAEELSQTKQREWEPYARFLLWVYLVDKEKYQNIVINVDIDRLDENTLGLWETPPRELRLLVVTLAANNRVRSWVESHQSEIKRIDPLIGRIAPQVVLNIFSRGGCVDFCGHNGHDWNAIIILINRINKLDREITINIIKQNLSNITKCINTLCDLDCEKSRLILFLNTISKIDPELIRLVFESLDVIECNKNWLRTIESKKRSSIKTAKKLIELSEQFGGNWQNLKLLL
ncbi:hypothetical protein SDC9_15062 [bioreactor metagenome]|uniref:Novel STAND NTPase 3 domain-containing protein n=1 Tax=bioreactor metagenome TaxID=1076179 RepID=A0A644TQT8_9ZZZZ|nr:hypothetical protein [Negativicutes bacterium]